MRDLIRRDQKRADKLGALRRFIDEAEVSGVSPRGIGEIVAETRS